MHSFLSLSLRYFINTFVNVDVFLPGRSFKKDPYKKEERKERYN